MYNTDTELLYPMRVTPMLRNIREAEWAQLVDRVTSRDADSNEQVAFTLMMVKLDGCANCNTDSFRAMRGCTQCARQNIKRFRGNDQELIKQFAQAKSEVDRYLKSRNVQDT
ncbi:MAG: hypothetical protein LWX83_18475 [Anaerolineae bacterium]|nr:hypothetical protein [Anaerolineae bacterium]